MNRQTVFLIATLLVAATSFVIAQPMLQVVGGTSLDFGKIYRGDQIERNVTLKNTGSDTLMLGSVEVSCGCTGTALSEQRIAPGGSGSLLIKFNSKNFSGSIHKTVTINSNSAQAARTVIEFVGNIVDEIILTPNQFWFKEAQVGKESSLSLTIQNAGTDTLRLTGYRSTLKDFSLTLPKAPIPPGGSAEVVATFKPKQASAILADRVFLETSNARQPDVTLPVYGTIKP